MKRLTLGILVWSAAGCGSVPEAEQVRVEVFQRISALFDQYNRGLQNRDPFLLELATKDLKRLVPARFVDVLEGLSSEDSVRRANAAFALGFSGSRHAIDPLVAATDPVEHSTVRINAIASLGLLGFAEIPLKPFKELVEDSMPEVRVAALYGLRELVEIHKDDSELAEILYGRLEDPEVPVRNEALIVLRGLPQEETVHAIVQGPVRDREPGIRGQAAVTLGMLGDVARYATPTLIDMLKDEVSEVVRNACAALNRLHGLELDRSYMTWNGWYEEELKCSYVCPVHREIPRATRGDCSFEGCGKTLERVVGSEIRKAVPENAVYVCVEHSEVMTVGPSRCRRPGCDKELVLRQSPAVYACPDHPEVTASSPVGCGRPGCGKQLVPVVAAEPREKP